MTKELIDKFKEIKNQHTYIKEEGKDIVEKLKNCCKDIDELKKLTYKEIKDLYEITNKVLSYEDRETIKIIVRERLIEQKPMLNRAIYFPELNELEMDKKEIIRIDREISRLCLHPCREYYKQNLNASEYLMRFLEDKHIVGKSYLLSCDCEDESLTVEGVYNKHCDENRISEYELEKLKEYWKTGKLDNEIDVTINCKEKNVIFKIQSLEEFCKYIKDVQYGLTKDVNMDFSIKELTTLERSLGLYEKEYEDFIMCIKEKNDDFSLEIPF